MDTELDVLRKGLVELGKVVLVLGNLRDDVHRLLDQVLADDLEDLVLLEGLTRNVEGQIFRIDDTLDKVEVLGDQILTVVHDEHAADIELDVVALLLGLEQIEGCAEIAVRHGLETTPNEYSPLGNEEDGLELELTLDREVLDSEMVFPVVGQALVERGVLLCGDVRGVACPNGLRFVEFLVGNLSFLDLLGLLFLLLILVDLLNLGLLLIIFNFFLVILDLL